MEGAAVAGGFSAIGAAFYSAGIPKNSILEYETSLKAGAFMLVFRGTPEEVARAQWVLSTTNASETHLHLADPVAAATA